MTNRAWVRGVYTDWAQEAQVDQQWTGSPDRNFSDGSGWDPTAVGSGRDYVWTDEAACRAADPELFQMSQKGDPDVEGLNLREVREHNEAKFKLALSYCEGCPIRAACLENADPSDLHWSVRGGELPQRFTSGVRQKNVPSFKFGDYQPRWECKIHGIKWVSSHKKKDREVFYYCLECNRKG